MFDKNNNNKKVKLEECLNDFQKKMKDIEQKTLKKIVEIMKENDVQKVNKIINDIKKII